MTDSTKKLNVCVVGAGAAGLCAARHLAGDSNFEVSVYEQTNDVGGTWVYREATGLDENGLPIHSSMYRDLRTNLPSKLMNFPDYMKMNAEQPSCVSHREVRAYLENYARDFDLCKYIQLNTRVERVRLEKLPEDKERWVVQLKKLKTNETEQRTFDAIMICNGHYFDPYTPNIPGIETFPGMILHSHSYRKREDFSGKTVFILGAASSGIDIGLDLASHVSRVYLSHNNERLTSAIPANMIQVVGVEKVEGRKFFLKDQTCVTADAFIFCTGYHYSFPFLDESCGIRVEDNYVTPLYKHLINIEHPTMCIVGVPSLVIPFPMFHVQVQYFSSLLKNVASLPSKLEMFEDSKCKAAKKRHGHKMLDKQWEYNDSLANAGRFDRLPIFYRLGFQGWNAQRKSNLLQYKDAKFTVSEDGQSVELVIPGIE